MAFCPHCGKSVGDQASRCAECGGELEARSKPARFKGTMMMSPGTAPLIQPPNAGQPRAAQPAQQAAPAPAPSAAQPSAAAIAATLPMPTTGPIADAAAAAAAGKKPSALKATMLGTGEGLGGIAQRLAQPQPQPQPLAQEPAEPQPKVPAAVAPAAPPPAAAPQQPAAVTRREAPPQEEDDSKRFLVGDPMAPAGTASLGGKPQRGSGRFSQDIPKDRSATFIVVGIIGVCVIAALGYIAARLMGIAN